MHFTTPKVMSSSAMERALRLITQPRAVLDTQDPAVQTAVYLEAVKRNGRMLDPAKISFTRGAVQANTLRKRCAMPRTVSPDLGWLAVALLRAEAGDAVATTELASRTFAESFGLGIDASSPLVILNDNEPLPADLDAVKRLVTIRQATERRAAPPKLNHTAEIEIDDVALSLYEDKERPLITVETSRAGEMAELAALDALRENSGANDFPAMISRPIKRMPVNDVYDVWSEGIAVPDAGRPHPAPLVLSKTLASIDPPTPRFTPNLKKDPVLAGSISVAQYEVIALAKDAHARIVPEVDGEPAYRMGFMLADGTGAGKTISSMGIIADNWADGRRRHVYITEKARHLGQAEKAAAMVGLRKSDIFTLDKYPTHAMIPKRDGILFLTYADLRHATAANKKAGVYPRLKQVLDWCGPEFDGVLGYDEAHNMRNAVANPEEQFGSDTSLQGELGIELQNELPMARVLYVTATGATEPHNLSYMTRLRLWGSGTAFKDREGFISSIIEGGVSAMEAVAAHLYSCGLMTCRNLSFADVSYRTLTHVTTKSERDAFDTFMNAIAAISHAITKGKITPMGVPPVGKPSKNGLTSHLEALAKRTTEMLYIALAAPTMIADMRDRFESGEACVVQIMNTYESLIDMSPTTAAKDQIMAYLRQYLPLHRMKRVNDEYVPDPDANGNLVELPDNIAVHRTVGEMLRDVHGLKSPIDQVFDAFGTEMIAEITGRTRRSVPPNGAPAMMGSPNTIEDRTGSDITIDLHDFMGDRKHGLLFSLGAGGSSLDYHASRDVRNQRKRNHYISQAGNNAGAAVQGLGRTHRANQAVPPTLVIVTTDLPGQKAYRSQIMKRIGQLGAMGQGHRDAATNNAFDPRDSYEGPQANAAWTMFLKSLAEGRYPEIDLEEFNAATGLRVDKNTRIGINFSVHRLLNRVARCPSALQDRIFSRVDEEIENAIAKAIIDRSYDAGPALIPGKIELVNSTIAIQDKVTRGCIVLHEFKGATGQTLNTYQQAIEESDLYNTTGLPCSMWRSRITANVWLEIITNPSDDPSKLRILILEPHRIHSIDGFSPLLRNRDRVFDKKSFADMWDARIEMLKDNAQRTNVIASGALPLIWEEISDLGGPPRLVIAETTEGKRIIGTILDPAKAKLLALQPGAGDPVSISGSVDEMHHGRTIVTANNWLINRQLIHGVMRTVLHTRPHDAATSATALRRIGVHVDQSGSQTLLLIPEDDRHDQVVADLLRPFPIKRIEDAADWSLIGR